MMTRLLVALAIACWAVPAAAADWVRVETPGFVVYGDAAESRVRDIAVEFERFREAMAKVLPAEVARSPVPTVVVMFGTRRAYDPYRPTFNGRRIELSGYFYSNEDENTVTLALDDRTQALRTTFHEYAHIITSNVAWDVPVWANEGLAEYYSTFSLASNGREALLGDVLLPHLTLLGEQKLLSLPELLGVTFDSPLYNEGNRRSVFYAQSWALVHMLLSGTPDRSAELWKYIRAAAAGVPAEQAWRDAFGSFDAIDALRRYLDRNVLRARAYKFPEGVSRAAGGAVKVPPAEIEAVLAGIVRHTDGVAAAAPRLEKALAMTPPSPHAAAGLAGIRLAEQRDDDARALLMAASAQQGDWLVQYRVATGLRRLIAIEEGSAAPEVVEAARRAIEVVSKARPDLVHPLALTAEIDLATRSHLERGLAAIGRARTLAPGRETYAFTDAQIRLELGRFAEARAILQPMTSLPYRAEIREHAEVILRNVTRLERFAASAPPPGAALDEPLVPEYRTLKPGEQRAEGFLERIECGRSGVLLHLRSGGKTLRFEARQLQDVEFLVFRRDQTSPIGCGPRTPADAVYLTWRPPGTPLGARTSDGEAVAVEFIPKDK